MGRARRGARVLGPYQRSDGRFAMVLRGPPVQGGSGEEWFYFETLRAAQKAKREMEAGLRAAEPTTLAEAIEEYQGHLRATGRKDSTIEEAGSRLRPLVEIVGRGAAVEELKRQHVERRLAGLAAVESRHGTLGRTRAFCTWAMQNGHLNQDPTLGLEVTGRRRKGKPTLTRVEARRLDEMLWGRARHGNPAEQEKALAVLMLLYCAFREGEFLRLQVRDLDIEAAQPVASVERWGKTGSALRDMEIPAELTELLRKRVEGKPLDAWVWPSPTSESGHREKTWVLKATKAACRAAGLQVVCVQGLRATHAKLARDAGTTAHVIAQQLGHSGTKVTTDNYIGNETGEAQRSRTALRVLRGGKSDP